MSHLIIDANTDIVSASYRTRGGKHEVICWAEAWGGAQIEIQILAQSPNTTEWITLFDTVLGTAKIFTINEQSIIDLVATGNELRAVLSGTTGTSSNINCIIRGIA